MAAFGHAARLRWADPSDGLDALITQAFADLREL